ncbi:hypothetical protein [Candidatus Palauibacter sp.]|uniref:hypothetical protein n=1 Tax=Candidatus Palauibacter sp. TaxID=3101350 RepID=UPI003B51B856
MRRYLKDEVSKSAPLLREIGRTVQHEGDEGTYEDVEGREDHIEYETMTAGLEITRDEMRHGSFSAVMAKFKRMAETLAEAQGKMMFTKASEAAESVGNVVAAKDKPIREALLEMQRKIQLDFDPRTGEPRHHTMVVHPETFEKIKDDLESLDGDSEFLAELSEIKQKQWMDWRDRESRRRLVD